MSVSPPPEDSTVHAPAPPAATEAEPAPPARPVRLRWAWWLLAYASLALGIVGIVVPGLPTVPFVLLSAFAASRGSQRLHAWLLAHRQFGPMIRDWQAHGAVSRRAKRLAVSMMALCAAIMFLTSPKWWMAASGTAIMCVVAVWLWRRPEPPG
ncbi:YbaN family protein [Lysobacter enzymogenes]|uniref:YbaN family protein n=1 Tax=Lysobacter enzymogenes TaxID=69 RepID=UPI00384F654E